MKRLPKKLCCGERCGVWDLLFHRMILDAVSFGGRGAKCLPSRIHARQSSSTFVGEACTVPRRAATSIKKAFILSDGPRQFQFLGNITSESF
jgi:hypothetical protein